VVRGGGWDFSSGNLASSYGGLDLPTAEGCDAGFRVASIPEPNSTMLILAAVTGLVLMRRRPSKL